MFSHSEKYIEEQREKGICKVMLKNATWCIKSKGYTFEQDDGDV